MFMCVGGDSIEDIKKGVEALEKQLGYHNDYGYNNTEEDDELELVETGDLSDLIEEPCDKYCYNCNIDYYKTDMEYCPHCGVKLSKM